LPRFGGKITYPPNRRGIVLNKKLLQTASGSAMIRLTPQRETNMKISVEYDSQEYIVAVK